MSECECPIIALFEKRNRRIRMFAQFVKGSISFHACILFLLTKLLVLGQQFRHREVQILVIV